MPTTDLGRPTRGGSEGRLRHPEAVLAFIAVTNAPTLPDSSMASASAASFADPRAGLRATPDRDPLARTQAGGGPPMPLAEDGVRIDADGSMNAPPRLRGRATPSSAS